MQICMRNHNRAIPVYVKTFVRGKPRPFRAVALRVRSSHLVHRDAFALNKPSSSPYAGVAKLRSATTLFFSYLNQFKKTLPSICVGPSSSVPISSTTTTPFMTKCDKRTECTLP